MATQVNDLRTDTKHLDVLFVRDAYDTFVENGPATDIAEIQDEVRVLTGIVNSHGTDNRLVGIMHQDDLQRIEVYKLFGYTVYTMNGHRTEELKFLVTDLVENINQKPPRKLIAVSAAPVFNELFSASEQNDIEVSVWLPGSTTFNPYQSGNVRNLGDILPFVIGKKKVVVRLDVENHLFGFYKAGRIPDTKSYLNAIRDVVADFGDVINIQAFADWKRLREALGRDFQCEFEQSGVRTIYRINIPGKNTNDMALAGNVQESLERFSEASVFVIGTGDADFMPLIDAIHDRGKKAVLITLRGSLSLPLAGVADEIRYLDTLLPTSQEKSLCVTPIVDETFTTVLRLAGFLHGKHWKYAFYNRLPDDISKDDLERLVENGLLVRRFPDNKSTVAINTNNTTGCQVLHFVPWITKFLYSNLVKREKKYCDTTYIHNAMKYDRKCRELNMGQSWRDTKRWLEVAESAGILRMGSIQHPKNRNHFLSTWRLASGKGGP